MDEREEMDKQREDKEREQEEAMHVDKDILIKKFDAALEEMKEFTKSMNKQMEEELAAVKAVREATRAHLVQMQEEQAKAKAASEVCFLFQSSSERCFTANPTHSPQTPVLTSLKRKRDDIDENEDEFVAEERREREATAVDVNMDKDKAMDVDNGMAVDGDKVPSAILGLVEVGKTHQNHAPNSPPPRKRARRLASVVAQTATAVTIGAVVTWSALAFS